jgi:1,4-alpha-glucan branching enzyme
MDADESIDWHLLDEPAHAGVRRLGSELNRLLHGHAALYAGERSPKAFSGSTTTTHSKTSWPLRASRPRPAR